VREQLTPERLGVPDESDAIGRGSLRAAPAAAIAGLLIGKLIS
jgi:hypothetical protein